MSLNLAECVAWPAQAHPDKIAVVSEDLRMTYRELAEMIQRTASLLARKGLGRGSVVALMLSNTAHFPILYYGTLWAGATVLTMNPTLRRREIQAILEDSGADIVFAEGAACEEAANTLSRMKPPIPCVEVETRGHARNQPQWESFAQLASVASPEFDMAPTAPEDVAILLYTSGIPDRSCGVELTHFNLFQNALTCKEYALGYRPEDICLAVLPLFHGFGQTSMMNTAFLTGNTVVMCQRFEAHHVLDLIARERITIIAMVPAMFQLLLASKKAAAADLSSVRVAITGGAAMPVEVARRFTEQSGIPVLEGYGLTETSPVVSFNRPGMHRLGSIGKPVWGCQVRIMRPDGSFAPPGEKGEIVVRGHNVMKGYRNQPQATANALAGGWLHTRDVGHFDDDGFLYITGIAKDLIITGGMNVSPSEIESVLMEHPEIAEAAVAGLPDPLRGETITAFVVFHNGKEVSEKDLSAYCRDELAPYKRPRRFVRLAALPRDASGRVPRDQLAAGTY